MKVVTNILYSQGVFERKIPQKLAKLKKAQPYQVAEKLKNNCHIPNLVQAFTEEKWVKPGFSMQQTSHLYDSCLQKLLIFTVQVYFYIKTSKSYF